MSWNQFAATVFILICGCSDLIVSTQVQKMLTKPKEGVKSGSRVCLRSSAVAAYLKGLIVEKWKKSSRDFRYRVAGASFRMSFIKRLTTTVLGNYHLQFATLVLVLLT